jgi:hypothetical protein
VRFSVLAALSIASWTTYASADGSTLAHHSVVTFNPPPLQEPQLSSTWLLETQSGDVVCVLPCRVERQPGTGYVLKGSGLERSTRGEDFPPFTWSVSADVPELPSNAPPRFDARFAPARSAHGNAGLVLGIVSLSLIGGAGATIGITAATHPSLVEFIEVGFVAGLGGCVGVGVGVLAIAFTLDREPAKVEFFPRENASSQTPHGPRISLSLSSSGLAGTF